MSDCGTRILYDRKCAAAQLSISVRSLDYLISKKKIPVRRIASRILLRHEDLRSFARGNHTDKMVISTTERSNSA